MCNCNSIALQLQWVSLQMLHFTVLPWVAFAHHAPFYIADIKLTLSITYNAALHCVALFCIALHCCVRLVCTLPSIPPWYWRHTSSVLSGVGLPLTRLVALLLIPPPTQIGSCLHFAEAPLRCRGTAEAKFYPFLWQNEPWVANHIVVSQGTLWPTNGSRWPVLKPLPRSKMWYLPNSSESYDLSITCQWLVPWPGLWLWFSWKIGLSGPLYSHSS